MGELLDYLKEDGTMYLLLGFFLFHAIVAEECPVEKRVGDTCYTRVAIADTNQYGCMENCTYKKTDSSDTGLYCFKTGSLQVTDCGTLPGIENLEENGGCDRYQGTDLLGNDVPGFNPIIVGNQNDCEDRCFKKSNCNFWSYNTFKKECWLKTGIDNFIRNSAFNSGSKACGSGCVLLKAMNTINSLDIPGYDPFQSKSQQDCADNCYKLINCNFWTYNIRDQNCWLKVTKGDEAPQRDLVSGNKACGAGSTTNEFDFGPYMGALNESLVEFEDDTDSAILFPSADSCSFYQKIKCLAELGFGLAGCVSCKRDVTCWLKCLKKTICALSSYCLPGGSCFDDLLDKISSALGASGLTAKEIEEILEALKNFVCSK